MLAAGFVLARKGINFELFGLEIDPKRAERAKTRLVDSFGTEFGRIQRGDALEVEWPHATAILANPPWVSFSGREAAPKDADHLQRHADTARSLGHWPSLHGAFLARIAAHVRSERTPACVLLPASVAEQEGYGPLRAETTRLAQLARAPERLDESAFPEVSVPSFLLSLEPRRRDGAGSQEPWSSLTPDEAWLRAQLEGFPRLAQECFADPGVHTGNSAALLIREQNGNPELPGIREGRDLQPYRLDPARRILDVHVRPNEHQRFRYSPLERYTAAPILLRQTARRPCAALHTAPTYFRNSLLVCTPPAQLAPEFCVAVLNSTVAAAWHLLSFREARQRSFPQVKLYHLRSLPFPFIDHALAPEIHAALVERVRSITEENLERLTEEIDELVFEAFGFEAALQSKLRAASECQR